MRERLKRFYNENEDVVDLALLVAGIGTLSFTFLTYRKTQGLEIVNVFRRQFEDGGMDICVLLKNGNHREFHWTAEMK